MGGVGLEALLVALALLCGAAAIPAPHGAYLGCFASTTRQQIITEANKRIAPGINKVFQYDMGTFFQCAPTCARLNFIFASLSLNDGVYTCTCTSWAPGEDMRLSESACNAGGAGVALFYLHKNADSTLCTLAELPFSSSSWGFAYGKENTALAPDGTLSITMQTNTGGARLHTQDGDHLYGVYQLAVQPAGAAGVVTAFYARSSKEYPNNPASLFSEIDFEWCSAYPCGPSSIWLNSLTWGESNGERILKQAEYQKLLGWVPTKRTDNSFATYTINWQPDYVSWHVGGRLVHVVRTGQQVYWTDGTGVMNYTRVFRSPDKPSHVAISMWTDTRPHLDPIEVFGGVFDPSRAPYTSAVRSFRRVVCDKPAEGSTPRGPSWLYSRRKQS